MSTQTKLIAYICGPITGLPDENRAAFKQASETLTQKGYIVHNPHEVPEHKQRLDDSWTGFMRRDIPYVCKCHVLVTLPDWDKSRGATLEVYLATQLSIPVIDIYQATDMSIDAVADMVINSHTINSISLQGALATVAKVMGVSISDIAGNCRKHRIAEARQLYYYVATRLTKHTTTKAARLVNKDHSTVIYGARRVQGLLQVQDEIAVKAVRDIALQLMTHATH